MAEKGNDFSDLDDLAFQIYTARVANGPTKRSGEGEALDSFRKAEAFLAVRKRVKAGEFKPTAKPEGPQLCDCCAPNLPKSHPHNLVSQRYGSLERVARIKAWLDRNPTPEADQEELAAKLNREFSDLHWDLPTINVARAIFPAYVTASAKN